jgi:1-acyl-sn-glycerol-3-phosphate acyltransferase
MADAEIIPLGTRGRPGRGTGTERPSARSRNLAGNGKTGRASSGAAPADAVGAPHEPATTEPTSPTVSAGRAPDEGIPVEEILAAVLAAARETFGDDGERRLAHVLAFLRRRVTGDYEVDEFGLDPHLTTNLFFNAIRPLAEKWFRVEVRGLENLPRDGGALIVGNHSGTLPVDGLVTAFVIHEATGRFLRLLGADLVFRMPFVGEIARRGGVTLACVDDACRLLRKGELVGVWPEGYKGIGKQFSQRYQLQRFGRGGFVASAINTGVPIVPCSIVGAEEIYPLIGDIPALARLLGLPYFPVTPLFPLLGPLGMIPLPSKWIIEFGEPIRTDEYDAASAEDPMTTFDLTDQVRESIQQTLYRLLVERNSAFH